MSHSFTKVWIHAVWSTKNRMPLIQEKIESRVFQYMREQLQELGCHTAIINGMPDHIHCLFMLSPQKSLSDIIKQIKGSTAHYINHEEIISEKFSWQTGYSAFSVSAFDLRKVYRYIARQKEHHRKKTIDIELSDLGFV